MSTPPFLTRLMQHRSLSVRFKLGPEDSEAYRFANALRAAALEGRLSAVFLHPANELANSKGKRVSPAIALAKALGLITGASDYLFLWDGGSAAIEFKSAKGSLSKGQRDFRDWCAAQGVPFHIARSCEQGLQILKDMGVLK